MRIVTALILVSLLAAVYIANSGSSDDQSTDRTVARIEPAAIGVTDAELPVGDEGFAATPGAFPEGLSGRSSELGVNSAGSRAGVPNGGLEVGDEERGQGSDDAVRAAREEIRSAANPFLTESPAAESSDTESPTTPSTPTSSEFEPIELARPEPLDPSDASTTASAPEEADAPARRTSFVGGDAGPVDLEPTEVLERPRNADPKPTDPVLPRDEDPALEVTEIRVDPSADATIEPEVAPGATEPATVPVIEVADPLATEPSERTPSVEVPSQEVPRAGDGDLEGRLVDEGGSGIEGATILVVDAKTKKTLDKPKTDAEGRFSSKGLDASRVQLSVQSDTVPLGVAAPVAGDVCRTGDEPLGFGAVCIDLDPNQAAKATIELPYSSGVQGSVKDGAGKLVEGALVRAVSKVKGFESVQPVGETDADGFFFLMLVPGPYELQVLTPGDGDPRKRSRRQDIEAEAGSAIILEAIDFSKPAPARRSTGKDRPVDPKKPAVKQPRKSAGSTNGEQDGVKVADAKGSAPVEAPVTTSERMHATEASGERPKPATVQDGKPAPKAKPIETPNGGKQKDQKRGDEERPETPAGKTPAKGKPADDAPADAKGPQGATLSGRAISTWGEAIDGLAIVCRDTKGEEVAKTQTRADGRYELVGVPAGAVVVHIAPDSPLGKRGPLGHIVRKRPEPIEMTLFDGQTKARIDDVVVDVAPVFRLEGKIDVAEASLDAFKKDLIAGDPDMADLSDERFLSAYLRGLALVQRNRGGQGKNRPVVIESDGSFTWQCNLPAEDVLFELRPRTTRGNAGYAGSVGVVVTPAGVRARELTIDYPGKK